METLLVERKVFVLANTDAGWVIGMLLQEQVHGADKWCSIEVSLLSIQVTGTDLAKQFYHKVYVAHGVISSMFKTRTKLIFTTKDRGLVAG
jgi:hypothetical protein